MKGFWLLLSAILGLLGIVSLTDDQSEDDGTVGLLLLGTAAVCLLLGLNNENEIQVVEL